MCVKAPIIHISPHLIVQNHPNLKSSILNKFSKISKRNKKTRNLSKMGKNDNMSGTLNAWGGTINKNNDLSFDELKKT